MERRNAGATVGAIALLSWAVACETLAPSRGPLLVPIRTDSAEVGVRFSQDTYFGKIGFFFVNDTGKPLSRAGCGGPGWPALEKKSMVNGHPHSTRSIWLAEPRRIFFCLRERPTAAYLISWRLSPAITRPLSSW